MSASGGTKHDWEKSGDAWGLQEDEAGALVVEEADGSTEEQARRRNQQNGGAGVQRGIIRYVVIVLDMSQSSAEPDTLFAPDKRTVTLQVVSDFIRDFFAQNPICNIAVVSTRFESLHA